MAYHYDDNNYANAGIDSSGRALVTATGVAIRAMSIGETLTFAPIGFHSHQVTLMSIVGTTFTIKIC